MGDLSGIVAQADPTVERDRPEPDRTAVRSLFENLPKTHVVSLVRALAIRLLESELFFFALIIERADGSIAIRPVQDHATDDLNAGSQRYCVRRIPARRVHGVDHIFLATDQPNVERVTRNTGTGSRDHGQRSQARL